jgi:hypothetical protein
MTVTSVGYGDISAAPFNVAEELICVAIMLLTGMLWGYLIGIFCTMAAPAPTLAIFREDMSRLNSFMASHRIAPELRFRLREYMHQAVHLHTLESQSGLLSKLSPAMQGEVALLLNEHTMDRIWYLHGADLGLLIHLSHRLKPTIFPPAEFCPIGFLYLLERGLVIYCGRTRHQGCIWGEDALLDDPELQLDFPAVAVSYTSVLTISDHGLTAAISEFPKAKHKLDLIKRRWAIRRAVVRSAEIVSYGRGELFRGRLYPIYAKSLARKMRAERLGAEFNKHASFKTKNMVVFDTAGVMAAQRGEQQAAAIEGVDSSGELSGMVRFNLLRAKIGDDGASFPAPRRRFSLKEGVTWPSPEEREATRSRVQEMREAKKRRQQEMQHAAVEYGMKLRLEKMKGMPDGPVGASACVTARSPGGRYSMRLLQALRASVTCASSSEHSEGATAPPLGAQLDALIVQSSLEQLQEQLSTLQQTVVSLQQQQGRASTSVAAEQAQYGVTGDALKASVKAAVAEMAPQIAAAVAEEVVKSTRAARARVVQRPKPSGPCQKARPGRAVEHGPSAAGRGQPAGGSSTPSSTRRAAGATAAPSVSGGAAASTSAPRGACAQNQQNLSGAVGPLGAEDELHA